MSEFLFSVAVAACNVEPYLPTLIQSLEQQKFSSFELIFTCEKSDDRTVDICRECAERHSAWRVVEFPRSGSASICRNYAMDHARGQYLIFLDGDDWIEPDSFQRFADALSDGLNPDVLMVKMDQYWICSDGTPGPRGTVFANFQKERKMRTGLEVLCDLDREGLTLQGMTPLNLYRTAFLRERSALRQIPKIWLEDLEWVIRVFFYAERVAALDFIYYHYVKRPASKTSSRDEQCIFNAATALSAIARFFYEHRTEFPVHAARTCARVFLHMFFWCFFSPHYSAGIPPAALRRALLQWIAAPGQFRQYRALARFGSRSKRLFTPLVWLARFPGGSPFLFLTIRHGYFPLCAWMERRKQKK